MTGRWVKRRSHDRQLPSGRTAWVRECWLFFDQQQKKSRRYGQPCPVCGAKIVSVHMPNGGWAHFESAKGLTRIKHPCLHIGEGLSQRRDRDTLDLFEGG
jgi:hypothetical protein